MTDITIVKCDNKHDRFQKDFTSQYYWLFNQIKEFKEKLPKELSVNERKNKYLIFEKELQVKIDSNLRKDSSNQLLLDYVRYSAFYYIYKDLVMLGKDIENPVEKNLFYAFLNDSIIFNDKALITSCYRNFLNHYAAYVEQKSNEKVFVNGKSKEQIKQELFAKRLESKMAIRKGIWSECLGASTLFQLVIAKEEDFTASEIDYYINLVQKKFTDKYVQQLLSSMLISEQIRIKERENKDSPLGVTDKTSVASMPGERLFNEILTNNKGKVIYVDIWATWCSPCKEQFPYSMKMHEIFKEKDVTFVYLCCQSQKEAYQNTLKKYHLEGEHYLLENDQYEYFQKRFLINGVPRYILIGKSGEIINRDASRPDSEQIIIEINKLINK